MKCSKCGHRSNSIAAMSAHYRKKHPGAMKRRKSDSTSPPTARRARSTASAGPLPVVQCPRCGQLFVPS